MKDRGTDKVRGLDMWFKKKKKDEKEPPTELKEEIAVDAKEIEEAAA